MNSVYCDLCKWEEPVKQFADALAWHNKKCPACGDKTGKIIVNDFDKKTIEVMIGLEALGIVKIATPETKPTGIAFKVDSGELKDTLGIPR